MEKKIEKKLLLETHPFAFLTCRNSFYAFILSRNFFTQQTLSLNPWFLFQHQTLVLLRVAG